MATQQAAIRVGDFRRERAGWRSIDVLDVLFLVGAFIAPMDLKIFRAFTVYDFSVIILGFLVIAARIKLRPLPEHFGIFAYVFCLAALASAFRATFPVEALTQTLQFAFSFFLQLPLLLSVVRTRFVLRAGLVSLILSALVVALLAMAFTSFGGGQRVAPFFNENPNRLGWPTAFVMPFLLHFLVELWQAKRKALAVCCGAVALYPLVWALGASASRGAAVGTVVSLVMFVLLAQGRYRARTVMVQMAVAAVVVGALGFMLFRTDVFPTKLRERAESSVTGEGMVEDHRWRLNVSGLRAVQDSLLIGTGLDNFRYESRSYGAASDQSPHSLAIQLLAEVGLIGTIAFLALIVAWFGLVWRTRSRLEDGEPKRLLGAFIASVASLMAMHVATPGLLHRHYWLILGLGMALCMHTKRDRTEEAERVE